jgi:hypothetical protein
VEKVYVAWLSIGAGLCQSQRGRQALQMFKIYIANIGDVLFFTVKLRRMEENVSVNSNKQEKQSLRFGKRT